VEAARIVRFLADDGLIHFGDAILPDNTTDAFFATSARVIEGDILGNFTITNQVKVQYLICLIHPKLIIIKAHQHTPLTPPQ
jgi:hypothetical protein